MSLLHEIEEQARSAHDKRSLAAAASRAQEELDTERARPVLEQVERYLRRVASALNSADESIPVSYQVPDVGTLDGLRQANYQVARDPEDEDTLRFHFECGGGRAIKGVLASEPLARAREMALVEAGLRCRRVAQGNERKVLLVEARVPVTLRFKRSGSQLELQTRNLLGIESRGYNLPPGRVDDEFLEALLEIVMRRGNRLATLTGDVIPESNRQQLRKELARQQRRREAELGGAFSRVMFPLTEAFRRLVLRQ